MMRLMIVCSLALALAACGGSDSNDSTDAGSLCGNGALDPGETCDDGNTVDDDDCTSVCELPCGDGRVQPSEECDIAIAEGETGACPTACADSDVCTDDALVGDMCQAKCEFSTVDFFRDGDMCCPSITDNNRFNDLDCAATCGNGIVELGETCDTAIASGMPGACPTACDDGEACTDDTLDVPADNEPGDGACRARCVYTERTTVMNGDSCCPAGANHMTDDDCVGDGNSTTCGNGVRNGGLGELCDTAIAPGNPGACPTSCAATSDPCRTNMLLSAGTCRAKCFEVENVFPSPDDMCCPVFHGANNRNDNDCTTSCGTPAEECSPPGVGTCDGNCRIERTGLRVITISIMDPHIYFDNGGGLCGDLTDIVNGSTIPNAMKDDVDMDGFADLTWVHSFIPLDQSMPTNSWELVYANCTPGAPESSTCFADPLTGRLQSTATNQSTGSCLDVLANTTTAGYTAPDVPMGPCFVTGSITTDIELGSLTVPLQDAYIAATYDADPATGLVTGLLRGFVSETAAEAAVLPPTVPLLGGRKLSEILAGGIPPGSCTVDMVPIGDDRDLGPDGTTMGWYFYINFTAVQVPFDERPVAATP